MPVNDHHKKYDDNIFKWRLVRDCCEGSTAIKKGRRASATSSATLNSEPGSLYLPVPNANDNSAENRERYRQYLTRANFVNFTGHTKEALSGMVFLKDPVYELPGTIEEMAEDVNGQGETLESVIKRSLDEVLTTGRQGLLVDYPELPPGLTRAQTQDITPYFTFYTAESVINWKAKRVNGRSVLCMVVLKEEVQEPIDQFSAECKDQFRVLTLNDDGVYIQQLYNQDGELLIIDEDGNTDIVPRTSTGGVWYEIPFIFIGSVNNDAMPDKAPLYDLAEVNIAHYRNSADYEESCFLVGQPTPVISGLTQSWVEEVLNGRVEIGSRAAIALPEGGSAMLLQAAPNQLPAVAMESKEKQMIQIGAKIITDSGQAETAEAAKIRFAGQNSKLSTVVTNIKEAYKKGFEWAIMFAGGAGDTDIDINREYYDKSIDPALIMAKIQLMDRGVISVADIRHYLRKAGDIDAERTDDDIEDDNREVDPFV